MSRITITVFPIEYFRNKYMFVHLKNYNLVTLYEVG